MLSLILFLPLFLAFVVIVLPGGQLSRWISLVGSFGVFVLSIGLLFQFDVETSNLQMVEQVPWIPSFGISYTLGLDGISLWLVMLTTFLTPLTVLGSWTAIQDRVKGFHAALLALETTMLGTFLAFDGILFYLFFEASLIPMYFMIGIWGGPRRVYATTKFFIYTMFGSVLMLLGLIALMYMVKNQLPGQQLSASLLDFYRLKIPFTSGDLFSPQTLLFFAFAIAFAVKVPMFPVHTWLPDAHVEAPTPGSVILAAVMLKMGTYGFLRFAVPLFPDAVAAWSWLFLLLGVVGIIYGALVAMVQPDMKKLVAYSSVSHMGYVIIGIFSLNVYGVTGAVYQMLNHGISTGALFLLVGMVYERTHSREIRDYGGLATVMPLFTIFFVIVTMSSIAVPMTNGFVGEFLILVGTFLQSHIFGGIAVLGVVLGAVYMLWLVKRVFFGPEGRLLTEAKEHLADLTWRERGVLLPLIVLIFWMGIFPNHFLHFSKASVEHLVNQRENYEISVHRVGN